jgi:hypothetical protein
MSVANKLCSILLLFPFFSLVFSPCDFSAKSSSFQARDASWVITSDVQFRDARFFFAQHTKTGKHVLNFHKIYQTAIDYTK